MAALVRVKNLASRVLSLSARQLALDWQERCGYRPVLPETFVEQPRFSGSRYRAFVGFALAVQGASVEGGRELFIEF